MPLDTYANLQSAVLEWLGRPADRLLVDHVPDMVTLFEAEARPRLRTIGGEGMEILYTSPGYPDLAMPADFAELRHAMLVDLAVPLDFMAPAEAARYVCVAGIPQFYTIYGSTDDSVPCSPGGSNIQMRLTPPPDSSYTVSVTYLRGLPALSADNPSNWLLKASPTAYLFGVLLEAAAFIGHDERVPLWAQRREAAFAALERADIKARWGGPLQVRPDMAMRVRGGTL
jgi:hypothetical protein